MNNKKGFTLVEIIICITLLVIVGVGSFFGIRTVSNNITKKELSEIENKIYEAVNIYLETKKETTTQYYNENNGILVPLSVLEDEGYITFNNIDNIDKHYVVSVLGSEVKENKCIDNVQIGSWEFEKDKVVYLCSDTDVATKLDELDDKIDSLEERITKLEENSNNDLKRNLMSGYYIAKGANPNNWVEFEIKDNAPTTGWAYWPNNSTKHLWRIMSVNENGEMRLVYSQTVNADNSVNMESTNASEAKNDSIQYFKLKIRCYTIEQFVHRVYYRYNGNQKDMWTISEIISDHSDIFNNTSSPNYCYEGKKKLLYDNIAKKEWIIESDYASEYSSSGLVANASSKLKLGFLAAADYNESLLMGKTYLIDSNVIRYVAARKQFAANKINYTYTCGNSTNLYNQACIYSSGKITSEYKVIETGQEHEENADINYVTIKGTKYQPVVTLNANVKLISNSSCEKGAVLGTKECPYKLSCTNC